MRHINAIMQSHQVQKLSRTDISNAIRENTNVTDVLTSQEVTLILNKRFHCSAPSWYVSNFVGREHVWSNMLQKLSVVLRKHRISAFFSALFLIYPSVCRGCNFSWKVEQGSSFYAYRKLSSEWWPKEVRSEAITTQKVRSLGSKSYCEALLRSVLWLITTVTQTNVRNEIFLWRMLISYRILSGFCSSRIVEQLLISLSFRWCWFKLCESLSFLISHETFSRLLL